MNEKVERALEQLRSNAVRYRKTKRYYSGQHDLSFATEKFANTFGSLFREFAMNMCPAIVDAMRDKMRIQGFGVEEMRNAERDFNQPVAPTTPSAEAAATPPPAGGELVSAPLLSSRGVRNSSGGYGRAADTVAGIWRSNRMAMRAGEVHKEVLKNGDAFVIVWPAADGSVQIVPQAAEMCTVHYDEENPGRVAWGAKTWRDAEGFTRLNLYFPDKIEKYVSRKSQDGLPVDAAGFERLGGPRSKVQSPRLGRQPSLFETDSGFAHPRVTTGGTDSSVPNPFGVVPVFHFANNADLGEFGRSELEAAMPVQDGLNKAVLDMLVAMEVSAYRQRWAAGIEIEFDKEGNVKAPFKAGIDHLWLATNPDARFGDFAAADLEQFLKVKDGFRIDIASVTGTPLYYLMPQMRGFPSGESLRKAETRFLAKVRDRQEMFGAVWADVMSFALRVAGYPDVSLTTRWEDPDPRDERDVLENLKLKKDLGLSTEQALKETGYGDLESRPVSGE